MHNTYDTAEWLKGLPDHMLIGHINLPGTHNAAAINPTRRTLHTCQHHSITQQLYGGIRLLDVRLKIHRRQPGSAGGQPLPGGLLTFHTCHGRFGRNTFQSFSSLLDECRRFLAEHHSEFVILLLKIDDWSNVDPHSGEALAALTALLRHYPTLSEAALPRLGAVRGKLILYNRINDDPVLGTPIRWERDTAGSAAYPSRDRAYDVWVQDRYNDLSRHPRQAKLRRIVAALDKKVPENVVLNFASGTWFGCFGVYVMEQLSPLLRARGRVPLGWILFDYPFWTDVVATVIDSNF
jgi:1-phosphatidylinositol phosphodiesterase